MKLKLLSGILLVMISCSMTGQNSQVLYFMKLPQNHLLNPGLTPVSKLYVGIPALSGINVNISNNFLRFSDFLPEGREISKSTVPMLTSGFNSAEFLNNARKLNSIEPQASVQIAAVGFNTRQNYYVYIDIIDRFEANVVFPKDLFRLLLLGNEVFTGTTFDLSALRTDIKYYREIGGGVSANINPRLRLGARGKILFGLGSLTYRNELLDLRINPNFTNTLTANMVIKASGPIDFFLDPENKLDDVRFNDAKIEADEGRFLTNMRNPGLGVDLGAEYQLNSKITLSASVTDLGFIRWRSDITNLRGSGVMELEGVDFTDIRNGDITFDEFSSSIGDSLVKSLTFFNAGEPYTTLLPFGITVAGEYRVTDYFSAGLLSYSRKVNRQFKEYLSLSANFQVRDILTASLVYTAGNNSFSNLGAGFGVRAGFAQFYLMVDRIPVNWKRSGGIGDPKIVLPENWNTLNARFGINLLFGNRSREVSEVSPPAAD